MTASELRVLLICKEFPGFAPSGGIGTYAAVIAGALGQAGVDCHVLCVYPGLQRRSHSQDGYTVHTAPYHQVRGAGRVTRLDAAAGRLSHALSVWRAYRGLDLKFDVVEAPELYAEAVGIALAQPHQPLVIRLHSSYAQLAPVERQGSRDFRATVAIENFAIGRADIVVSTRSNLDEVASALRLDQRFTREIIYPVPELPLADQAVDSKVVLFAGRLERRKAPELLLQSAAGVLQAVPEARFRFAGSDTHDLRHDSYREYMEGLANTYGVAHAVEFLGALDRDALAAEMERAAVCAFPSQWESFGLVVAEAGAIGRPVVVSDIPAFRDFVDDGVSGRIVPRPEPQAWADVLTQTLQSNDLPNMMARRLRESLRERAAPSHVAELVLESYESAVRRRTARR